VRRRISLERQKSKIFGGRKDDTFSLGLVAGISYMAGSVKQRMIFRESGVVTHDFDFEVNAAEAVP